MTTIAYDGEFVAVDSYITEDDLVVDFDYKKLREVDGVKFFLCGDVSSFDTLIGKYFSPALTSSGDSSALIIDKGIVMLAEMAGEEFYCKQATYPMALGSGTALALGAMDAGASAVEAVSLAVKRDIYSGGRVHWREI